MRWKILSCLCAVPLGTAGLIATGVSPAAIAVLCLAVLTPWLVRVDLMAHRLPNALVLPGIGCGLLSCAGEWVVTGRTPLVPLLAGGACAGFLMMLNLVGGMGMGDVKLGAALGFASWNLPVAVISPVVAFFLGGLVSVVLLAAGRRRARIAFGPFLLGGWWLAVGLAMLSALD